MSPWHWVTVRRDKAYGWKMDTLEMANTGNMPRQKNNKNKRDLSQRSRPGLNNSIPNS